MNNQNILKPETGSWLKDCAWAASQPWQVRRAHAPRQSTSTSDGTQAYHGRKAWCFESRFAWVVDLLLVYLETMSSVHSSIHSFIHSFIQKMRNRLKKGRAWSDIYFIWPFGPSCSPPRSTVTRTAATQEWEDYGRHVFDCTKDFFYSGRSSHSFSMWLPCICSSRHGPFEAHMYYSIL